MDAPQQTENASSAIPKPQVAIYLRHKVTTTFNTHINDNSMPMSYDCNTNEILITPLMRQAHAHNSTQTQ